MFDCAVLYKNSIQCTFHCHCFKKSSQLARKFLPSSIVFILLDEAEDFLIAAYCLWVWEEGEVLGIHGKKQ